MQRISLALLSAAFAVFLLVCYFYGIATIIYSAILVISFFCFFYLTMLNASIQASANPGLERTDEPDFWFSGVYNAWLYVTDRQGWAWYASLTSYVLGALWGTAFGALLLYRMISFETSLVCWLSGMFLDFSIVVLVATSGYYTQTEEESDASYEEVEPLLD